MSQRYIWLDWMKVLSMYFIVWGHLFPEGLCSFIYSFNVPIFFVISGFFTKIVAPPCHIFRKTIKGLIIPYVFIVLSNIAIYAFMAKQIPDNLSEKLFGAAIGLQPYIGAMWFVYTLILIKCILVVMNVISKDERNILKMFSFICILCLILWAYWNTLDNEQIARPLSEHWPSLMVLYKGKITWAYTNVFAALPFFYAGMILKRYGKFAHVERLVRENQVISIVLSVILIVILFLLAEVNGPVWMYFCEYGNNLFLCCINIAIASVALFIICVLLKKRCTQFIQTMSIGNILVLGYHGIPLNITLLKAPWITTLGGEIIGTAFYAFILYILFFPAVILASKFCPIIIGGRRL